MTKYATVWKEIEFDAGHRVPNHKSKCRNLHGHRYKVRVGVVGPIVTTQGESDEGMVVDFGDLKDALMVVHDRFDHKTLLWREDGRLKHLIDAEGWGVILVSWIPTAENLAVYVYDSLRSRGFDVAEVQVYETPTSVAVYTGEHRRDIPAT